MKHLIAVTAACMTIGGTAFATPITDTFSSFVILGDSLSDNGNLFDFNPAFVPSPPYTDGKFSNGDIWNEGIAAEFGPTATANFAYGGATTSGGGFAPPSLDEQVRALTIALATTPLNLGATPLVSIWAGANDIRNAVLAGPAVDVAAVATQAASNVLGSILALNDLGVNDFLVFNLPDLGATAEANVLGYGAVASPATAAYNNLLGTGLGLLDIADNGINIIGVDIASLFADLIGSPADFGVENATQSCFVAGPACNPEAWLFWDGIHPTAFGHGLVQEQARLAIAAELAPVPLPASAPLLLAGFGLLGWYGRRRQAA